MNAISSFKVGLGIALPKPPDVDDFMILKPISKGAFGQVYLGKRKTNQKLYAIKVNLNFI